MCSFYPCCHVMIFASVSRYVSSLNKTAQRGFCFHWCEIRTSAKPSTVRRGQCFGLMRRPAMAASESAWERLTEGTPLPCCLESPIARWSNSIFLLHSCRVVKCRPWPCLLACWRISCLYFSTNHWDIHSTFATIRFRWSLFLLYIHIYLFASAVYSICISTCVYVSYCRNKAFPDLISNVFPQLNHTAE